MAAAVSTEIRYSYAHAPTLRAFANSNAFIRGVVGPFRSGKSSACCVEIVRRALAQEPGPDGKRRSRWLVVRNCYDDQTEILTEMRGWQYFRDLRADDRVASLKDGKELVYEKPSYHYSAPYKGEMIGLRHQSLDILVTPDHRLWATKTSGRKRKSMPYRHVFASDCYGMVDWRMKRDADEWYGRECGKTVDFFEFLGFWFAEGSAGLYHSKDRIQPHYNLNVAQKKYVSYVRDLLKRAELRFGEQDKGDDNIAFNLSTASPESKALTRELAACGKQIVRRIPQWIKDAPRAHLEAFLHGFLMGDGHFKDGPRDTTLGYTSSKGMADDLQEIAVRAGRVMTISKPQMHRTNKKRNGPGYVLTFATKARANPKTNRKRNWRREQYDGMVYCVEVPSHVVYVRRNGKPVWCGQTVRELDDTTIRTFHEWFPPAKFGTWRASDNTYILTTFPGCEIEVMFRALDRPDDVKNLLSLEVTGAWINEASEVPWVIIETIQGRVGQFPSKMKGGCTWSGIFMDTNPPDADSEWFKFFEETEHDPDHVAIFHQPSGLSEQAENIPFLNAGRLYYERLAIGKSAEWRKVFIEGQYGFVQSGKIVFPEYSDEMHCKTANPIPHVSVYRNYDFGLTPACVFTQLLPDGRLLVFDEIVSRDMGIERFADIVVRHSKTTFATPPNFIDIGDPAGMQRSQTDERTCFQIMHAKRIMIEPGIQSLALRLESIRKPLNTLIMGRPQFVLHPRCAALRKGFLGGYHYRRMQVSGVRYDAVPEKNASSHPMDALSYGCTRIFGPTLMTQQPLPGDKSSPPVADDYSDESDKSKVTGY